MSCFSFPVNRVKCQKKVKFYGCLHILLPEFGPMNIDSTLSKACNLYICGNITLEVGDWFQ